MEFLLKHKLLIGAMICCLMLATLLIARRSKSGATPQSAAPVEVEVSQVEQKDVPVYGEWIGTLDGIYTEGSFVRKGQLLFEIDQRPFQAVLDQIKGQLAQANSQLIEANAQVLRAEAKSGQDPARRQSLHPSGVLGWPVTAESLLSRIAAQAR
jgi:membrane fusion protein (multidrug efflux system)